MLNRRFTQGIVRSIPKKAEETREIPFEVSNGSKDRHNTVLNPAKWELENYRKNPIVGYMHAPVDGFLLKSDPDHVIGVDKDSHVEGKGMSGKLVGILKFDPAEINLLAEKVFRKVLLGSLRAASATFLEVGKGMWGQGDQGQGGSNETYYFSGQELIEWSIVNIPSNPGTGKRGDTLKTQSVAGLSYALSLLGRNYTVSQIKNMRVNDILTLLDGKDLGINTRDLDKVKRLMSDPVATAEHDKLIGDSVRAWKAEQNRLIEEDMKRWEKLNFTYNRNI